MTFYNISNHPSAKWSQAQREAAQELSGDGYIVDVPFPNVDPRMSSAQIEIIAQELFRALPKDGGVHMIQGEASLAFSLTVRAFLYRRRVVVATTERKAVEILRDDGTVEKTAVFEFVQFRDVHSGAHNALQCLIQEGL